MDTTDFTSAPNDSRAGTPPPRRFRAFALRLVLVLASLIVLWATGIGWDRWALDAKANFDYNIVAAWPWVMGFVSAGFLFGIACWMPRKLAFDWRTAAALSSLPLLGVFHPFGYLNFRWWPSLGVSFGLMSWVVFFGYLLGMAIASGFGEGARRGLV